MSDEASFFPHMPGEVFDTWLRPIIAEHGWPFAAVTDAFPNRFWSDLFLGYPLSVWAYFRWSRHDSEVAGIPFPEQTTEILRTLLAFFRGDDSYGLFYASRDRTRIASALEYIREHRRLPGVLVGVFTPAGFQLADGLHRVTAFLTLPDGSGITASYWLAYTPPEESSQNAQARSGNV